MSEREVSGVRPGGCMHAWLEVHTHGQALLHALTQETWKVQRAPTQRSLSQMLPTDAERRSRTFDKVDQWCSARRRQWSVTLYSNVTTRRWQQTQTWKHEQVGQKGGILGFHFISVEHLWHISCSAVCSSNHQCIYFVSLPLWRSGLL